MGNVTTKLVGDKKEWRRMEARADALPSDHAIVYDEIKSYLWRFTSGDERPGGANPHEAYLAKVRASLNRDVRSRL